MIENYRTGLLWNSVMKDADVQAGLTKLGFVYEGVSTAPEIKQPESFSIYPNPASNKVFINIAEKNIGENFVLKVFNIEGRLVLEKQFDLNLNQETVNVSELKNGLYLIQIQGKQKVLHSKLLISK